jgi:3-keto-disaccharide hydrolase
MNSRFRFQPTTILVLLLWAVYPAARSQAVKPDAAAKEQSLFDGQSLKGWKPTSFGGEGRVHVESGRLILEMGNNLTGITWDGGELPQMDYEISLEAMKVDGNDFFCGLTFPVADSFCSLIVGGWAGSVVGLSSLDGLDASENDTTRHMVFKQGRWYRIRVRVTPQKIEAWIDDDKVVDADTAGRRVGIRPEMEPSKPLGIATWITTAALRKIEIRKQ